MPRDDLEHGLVWGFASVAEHNGVPVVDCQNDVMDEGELQKTAHEFMTNTRTGGVMHMRGENGEVVKAGDIVESVVLTHELQKALGINLGMVPWLVCLRVTNAEVRKAIARGDLKGFSIAGAGMRTPMQ